MVLSKSLHVIFFALLGIYLKPIQAGSALPFLYLDITKNMFEIKPYEFDGC